jgi:hypothetical protein
MVTESHSYFPTGGLPPISYSWRQTPWDSRHSNFIFQLNTCGYNTYVTSSLTRGWVYRLQLLLVLASAVILRSNSGGTHDHILLSQIRNFSKLEGRSPYIYPPGTGWPGYTPGFPFRRLLRLAGLQWRYSTQPPQGNIQLYGDTCHCRSQLASHSGREDARSPGGNGTSPTQSLIMSYYKWF